MIKHNNINGLSHLFCVAPMMDWTGTSQKAKQDQQLSTPPRSVMSYQMKYRPKFALQRARGFALLRFVGRWSVTQHRFSIPAGCRATIAASSLDSKTRGL